MRHRKYIAQNRRRRGFSLIELLVATALFTIVVAVSAGSFLSILEASRQSRELNNLMLAVDFAMEDMSRTIRTGSNFTVSGSQISFFDEDDASVTYRHSGTKILKTTPSYSNSPLTPDDVEIQVLTFSENPNQAGNQPRIIINVVGRLGSDPDDMFYLQTSVTQRELNI